MAVRVPFSAWGCHLQPSGCGFPAPGVEEFQFAPIFTVGPIDFDKPMILLTACSILLMAFFLFAFRKPKIVPRGVQNVAELGYTFIRDGIARDVIGKAGEKYVPLLFTAFFMIWMLNFLEVVPGIQFPVTSVLAYPVAFAVIVYVTWVPLGMMKQGPLGFFKNMMFPPGLPKWLYGILAPIEFISNLLVRPFTHCIRLFANMFAGHLLLATFTVATWYLFSSSVIGIVGSIASFAMTIAVTAFELLIQGLQAYIFTLLTAVYIAGALEAEH
ncbi:MAG: F0F1 ATP synthase subunit A [Candidatus Nanopelagicales bacterium]|nr:F0F1 ATP synthase subunit A [Candidatus Nanopelagicales bacterium]MDZ4249118.1 F0F1 ATP synthase subunit A [Candidatus Nanopelagicales bacterium]